MITAKDIEGIHTSLAQHELFLKLIIERDTTLAKADAYRKVAIEIGHLYYSIITDMPGDQFVDAKALEILESSLKKRKST